MKWIHTRLTASVGGGHRVSERDHTDITASIIVCTHNRADMLDGCLRSILSDTSTVSRELIVVDNASSDATEEVMRELEETGSDLPVRYVRENRVGKSHALNSGVASAKGSLLLFTDDDVLVQPGWADALCAPFADPSVGAVGGRILPEWPFEPPEWMHGPHADHLTLSDWGPEPRLHDPQKGEFPCGANMSARAEIVRRRRPPFDPALGPTGRVRVQYEEYFLLRSISETSLIPYAPEAVVHHRILPERVDRGWMRRSYFQAGFGHARLERMEGKPLAPLPRRGVRATRALVQMRAVRRRNRRLRNLGPEDAWHEFGAHAEAGKQLERLFGRFPTVADWLAGHLV
jgi:glycosyltransferase involved in cell wall biosynthesis